MKIAELIHQMGEATKFMNGNRVQVREMHGQVREAIQPIVEAAGLTCTFAWDITTQYEKNKATARVLRYGVDLVEDKRYKHDRIGKLNKLTFKVEHDFISLDDTVEEAVTKLRYHSANENLRRLQKELDYKLQQVEEFKGYIVELQTEIAELAKIVKK